MGYEEEPPMNSGVMHTDAYSGTLAAGGALIGLKHRIGTGVGQEIDISHLNHGIYFLEIRGNQNSKQIIKLVKN